MTDIVKGFTVTLDKDYRDDDVEQIANAIRMIYGVKAVKNSIATADDWINRSRIKLEYQKEIYKTLENL